MGLVLEQEEGAKTSNKLTTNPNPTYSLKWSTSAVVGRSHKWREGGGRSVVLPDTEQLDIKMRNPQKTFTTKLGDKVPLRAPRYKHPRRRTEREADRKSKGVLLGADG